MVRSLGIGERRIGYCVVMNGLIYKNETAHRFGWAVTMPKDSLLIINLSGRGDKDVDAVMKRL